MPLRETLQSKPWIPTTLAVACCLFAAYMLYARFAGGFFGGPEIFYYNLDTKALVAMPVETVAPHTDSDGATLVEAVAYRCPCDGEDRIEVAYLKKMSDAAKALRMKYPPGEQIPMEEAGPMLANDAFLVATVGMAERNEWVPAKSREGAAITNAANTCPTGGQHELALPD
ncbi:MAG: hypothetical protein AAF750_03275 [Planctomycetota bacterium]